MTKKKILKFAKDMGFDIRKYTDPMYIQESAQKAGAVESLEFTFNGVFIDLNFELDEDGNVVGFSTSGINSFRGAK